MSLSLEGKSAVVMGLANKRSIAASIIKELLEEKAKVAASYLSDEKGRAEQRVKQACEEFSPHFLMPCDLNQDEQVSLFFQRVKEEFGPLHMLVHAVAFAPLSDIRCKTLNISREGFLQAMESSVYSFIKAAREATKIMPEGGSLVTLSYFGAEKAVPGYNLMGLCKSALESAVRYLACELGEQGIRVNCVSAGALKTLASSAIPQFQTMLTAQEGLSPIPGKLLPEEVAKATLFLLGEGSKGITGEILHVDRGYNILGAKELP